jgi:hypothetical protein
VLAVVVVVAILIVALLFAPFSVWNMGQNFQDSTPNVNSLNLNFSTDVGHVNVMTQSIAGNNFLISVSGNGSQGFLAGGSDGSPVTVSFYNQTVGDVLTVNCVVDVENQFSSQADVACNIFVNPDLVLNLNISSSAGKLSFTADKDAAIHTLSLHSDTGDVQANLESNVAVTGDVLLVTNKGEVDYRMSQTNIKNNCTVTLQSNTGSIDMAIAQTRTLQGNLLVNAATDTGSINVGLRIDEGVGAKISSQTSSFGDVNVDTQYFSGHKSPLQSNNYPAASNIEINNNISGLGSVNINAAYLTMIIPA